MYRARRPNIKTLVDSVVRVYGVDNQSTCSGHWNFTRKGNCIFIRRLGRQDEHMSCTAGSKDIHRYTRALDGLERKAVGQVNTYLFI